MLAVDGFVLMTGRDVLTAGGDGLAGGRDGLTADGFVLSGVRFGLANVRFGDFGGFGAVLPAAGDVWGRGRAVTFWMDYTYH